MELCVPRKLTATFTSGNLRRIAMILMVCIASGVYVGWHSPGTVHAAGLSWPSDQQFPSFASFDTLDVIDLTSAPYNANDNKILFSTLEGIVNRTQPRIYYLDNWPEGKNYWLDKLPVTKNTVADPFSLISKYRGELQGIIIYDPNQLDTVNLATTIAGVKDALVASPALAGTLNAAPYNLPTLVDLRTANGGGAFTSNLQVYQYAYDNYWSQTTRRIMIGLQPSQTDQLRDYAVALQGMTLWLDPRIAAEQALLNRFLGDMPVNSPYLGWWPQEQAGVADASNFGIPTFAADFLVNATVWGGTSRTINVPAIPATPALQNKIYVMMVMSDGDNVQENQHLTPVKWADPRRGQVPITWTLSPADVDVQPFILNYFWQTATANDAIVAGPSGLGYMYPGNWSQSALDTYVKTSNRYMQAAGMRVITIWNNGQPYTESIQSAYAQQIPSLLGVTLQECCNGNWKNTLPAVTLSANYAQNQGDLINGINSAASGWSGNEPRFIAVQGDANNPNITPTALYNVQQNYANNPDYVFVRGDHFFQLYRQANADTRLSYTFDSDAQGWTGATAGGPYDHATWEGNTGNPAGSLQLDGSDLGSPNGAPNAWFSHSVALPTNIQELSFETRSSDATHGGQLRVRLVDEGGTSHTLLDWETYRSQNWARRSANIAAYAGQKVSIYFEQNDSGAGNGEQRWIDTVQFTQATSTLTDWTFDSNSQDWSGATNGGQYDRAAWDGTVGNPAGSLVLDGSDLGSPNDNANAWFSNRIALPANAQNLVFETRSTDATHGGKLRVRLVDAGGASHTLLDWETYRSANWATRSANIAAYGGQTVTIYFEQNDSGAGNGEFRYVDHIRIQ